MIEKGVGQIPCKRARVIFLWSTKEMGLNKRMPFQNNSFVIYLQFLSYSIINRIYIKVKRHLIYHYINGQYIFLKTRGRNIILPDMVDSTKEKQHCFNVECMWLLLKKTCFLFFFYESFIDSDDVILTCMLLNRKMNE